MKMTVGPQHDPGDDSGIFHAILSWEKDAMEQRSLAVGHLGFVKRADDGAWMLFVNVNRTKKRQYHFFQIDPTGSRADCWKLLRLGSGAWTVLPSVHVPGQMHAFLTLTNVPEPPPWK